jgi:hypothetical protein
MSRAISLFVLASLLGFANRAAVGAPEGGAPAASGASLIRFNVMVSSTLPAGSIILCKGELVPSPNQSAGGITHQQLTLVAEAISKTVLRGSSAECALEIPFSWTGNGTQIDVAVRYEVDAFPKPGAPVILQRGVEQGIRFTAALPPGTGRLGFNSVP